MVPTGDHIMKANKVMNLKKLNQKVHSADQLFEKIYQKRNTF